MYTFVFEDKKSGWSEKAAKSFDENVPSLQLNAKKLPDGKR